MSGEMVEPRQLLVGRCRVSVACERGEGHEGLCAARVVTPLATVALVFSEDELLEFARYYEGLPVLMRPDEESPAELVAARLVAAAQEFIHASRASRRAVRR